MSSLVRPQRPLRSILKNSYPASSENTAESFPELQTEDFRVATRPSISPKRSILRTTSLISRDEPTNSPLEQPRSKPKSSTGNLTPFPPMNEQKESRRLRSILKAPPPRTNEEVDQTSRRTYVNADQSRTMKEQQEAQPLSAQNIASLRTNHCIRSILKAPSSSKTSKESKQMPKRYATKADLSPPIKEEKESQPPSATPVAKVVTNHRIRSILKAPSSPKTNDKVKQTPKLPDKKAAHLQSQQEQKATQLASATFAPASRMRSILKAPSSPQDRNDFEQGPEEFALAALGELVGHKKVAPKGKKQSLHRSQSCQMKSRHTHMVRSRADTDPTQNGDFISIRDSRLIESCVPINIQMKAPDDEFDSSVSEGILLKDFLKRKRDLDLMTNEQQNDTLLVPCFPEIASPSPSLLSTMTVRPILEKHLLHGLPPLPEQTDPVTTSRDKIKSITATTPITATQIEGEVNRLVKLTKNIRQTGEDTSVHMNAILPEETECNLIETPKSQGPSPDVLPDTSQRDGGAPSVPVVVCAQLLFSVGDGVEVDCVRLPRVSAILDGKDPPLPLSHHCWSSGSRGAAPPAAGP